MSYKNKKKRRLHKKEVTTHRPVLVIRKDLEEAVYSFNKAVRRRDYVLQKMFNDRIHELNEEMIQSEAYNSLHCLRLNQDKNLVAWQGKTLSLTINEADLAVKHLRMFFKQFLEDGFQPKEDWIYVQDNLEKALHDFRQYIIKMFTGKNIDINFEDFDTLEKLICKYMFTDQEMYYYIQYENKI